MQISGKKILAGSIPQKFVANIAMYEFAVGFLDCKK